MEMKKLLLILINERVRYLIEKYLFRSTLYFLETLENIMHWYKNKYVCLSVSIFLLLFYI